MNEVFKEQVSEALKKYCERYESQNRAAYSLKGVSSATVSQILNEKWELISEEMWRKIASQIGFSLDEWIIEKTTVYNTLYELFNDAQQDSGVHAIVGTAGCGKSQTAAIYVKENMNAFRLVCSEFWNRKTFLIQLLECLGRDSAGKTTCKLLEDVITYLKYRKKPLLILDEADKLTDQVLYFFISLYNQLEDRCGIILLSTDYMKKRIEHGLRLKKKGYNEIYSRFGRRFIELPGNTYDDQLKICQANGLKKTNSIDNIIENSDCDLRRVKKLTKANIKKANKMA